jgi:hypothetical protein
VLEHCRELLRQRRSLATQNSIESPASSCAATADAVSFVDLGSGSGELVFDAASLGMSARGIERNPLLVCWCVFQKWRSGIGKASFRWIDMWEKGVVQPSDTVVVVFGVPGIMARMASKLEDEMADDAWLLSNTFEVPGWQKVRTSGGVHFYRKRKRNRSGKSGVAFPGNVAVP